MPHCTVSLSLSSSSLSFTADTKSLEIVHFLTWFHGLLAHASHCASIKLHCTGWHPVKCTVWFLKCIASKFWLHYAKIEKCTLVQSGNHQQLGQLTLYFLQISAMSAGRQCACNIYFHMAVSLLSGLGDDHHRNATAMTEIIWIIGQPRRWSQIIITKCSDGLILSS